MKILYLTTALLDEDYNALLNKGYAMSNPSNQNFHSRLIDALKAQGPIEVISLVPYLFSDITLLDSGVFTYINSHGKFLDKISGRNRSLRSVMEQKIAQGADVLLYDSLNVHLGQVAVSLGLKHHLPVIAIVTDNPENLAKAPRFYVSASKRTSLPLQQSWLYPRVY
jgi:hypothetical protein